MEKEEGVILSTDESKIVLFEFIGFCISVLFFYIPYLSIWTVDFSKVNLINFILFIIMLFLGMQTHELLHGVGFIIFGKVQLKNLKFGIKYKEAILYTHCIVPVKMKVYRIAILLPGIILGAIPSIVGLFLGNHWLVLYGVIMISGAATDFVVFWKSKEIESQEYVIDHSNKIGFEIIKDTGGIDHFKRKAEKKTEENKI
ncbi:DUF3267 domain-containing protein, partial [Halonatronum saccharophilum]